MLPYPLSCTDAAAQLGIKPDTLRKRLRLSNAGNLFINGVRVVIAYRQSGAAGQGKITLDQSEIERLIALEQVQHSPSYPSLPDASKIVVNGQSIKLGKYVKNGH